MRGRLFVYLYFVLRQLRANSLVPFDRVENDTWSFFGPPQSSDYEGGRNGIALQCAQGTCCYNSPFLGIG